MNKIAAIVPMKLHSERVPGKNLRLFNNKPLFFWIVEALTHCTDSIYIDTDSKEIISAVKPYFSGIRFILRPDALKGDDVSMNKILENDMKEIGCEHFIQVHSTSPLVRSGTLEKAIETYFNNIDSFDSLFSVSPIQMRCFTYEGEPINHNPEELIQTQFLKPVYAENSGIYIFSNESFRKKKRRIGEKPYLFQIDQYEAIDIDNENDFHAAEILFSMIKGEFK